VNDQRDTYEATRARLEEISAAARAKDVTLEKSIELLEEAVRLANLCTEHVDQVETFSADRDGSEDADRETGEAAAAEGANPSQRDHAAADMDAAGQATDAEPNETEPDPESGDRHEKPAG
jgi:exodeoxyribonuclease VII small subunit